jgi:hypothetical protein
MTNARKHSSVSIVLLAVSSVLSLLTAAQAKKEFSYTVGSSSCQAWYSDCARL